MTAIKGDPESEEDFHGHGVQLSSSSTFGFGRY